MAELDDRFEVAVTESKSLTTTPSQDDMLRLYALFKQAGEGDVTGKRPGFTNPVGRAKYDARQSVMGLSADDAKEQYIALVDSLK